MAGSIDQLLSVDPARLSHDERIGLLEQMEQIRSRVDATTQLTLAALAREGDAERRAKQWVREEVACVLSIAPETAGARLHDAVTLTSRLPVTFARLATGSMNFWHARVLVEACGQLDD